MSRRPRKLQPWLFAALFIAGPFVIGSSSCKGGGAAAKGCSGASKASKSTPYVPNIKPPKPSTTPGNYGRPTGKQTAPAAVGAGAADEAALPAAARAGDEAATGGAATKAGRHTGDDTAGTAVDVGSEAAGAATGDDDDER